MSTKTAKASTAPPAAKEAISLQVSLPQMLDLALGTPEVGAVNLNILHNFLHILLHEIDLRSTKVEYRGDDANRIKTMVSSLKAGPSLHLQEYSIIDSANKVKQRAHTGDAVNVKVDVLTDASEEKGDAAVTVKQSKTRSAPTTEGEKSEKQEGELKGTKATRQKIGPGTEEERETVIYVEPIVDGATPTALGFKRLEESVIELQQRFQALEELSTTPELVERLKGKITDPLNDVWQIINITKRLDASEQGIDKLTRMMQDVIKGDTKVSTEDTSALDDRLTNLENALNNLEQVVKNLQIINGEEHGEEGFEGEAPSTTKEDGHPGQRISLSQLLGGIDVKQMHQDVSTLQMQVTKMKEDLSGLNEKIAKAVTEKTQQIAEEQKKYIEQDLQEASEERKEEETAQAVAEKSEAATDAEKSEKGGETPKKARSKVSEKHTEDTKLMEGVDSEDLQVVKQRISKLEKDVTCLYEKVESAPMAGVNSSADLDELVSKIQGIQAEMDKLHQTADRLIDDRESREMHLNALLEQVELLKTIKADREDLEDALADKADAQAINRKVSYDQFDAACDDLAQGLEDAIGKLGKQETIWQEALDEVQKEIEGKVDKIEMTPLKDFVSTRLKSLQDKVKSVAQMRQDSEAAGTKKLLRDVQCISCDKNVVMKMEDTHKFRVETLPCTTSVKPYLTYELDQVRKQHRRLPHSRNMIQFEAALQEEARKQKVAKTDTLVKTPRDHLCNRYCGGSHTVTTPQQRVMRMGHFLTQWGPEIIQLTEGVIKGTDGKMYRSRPMPGKFDVCGPGYCEDRSDEVRLSDRPSTSLPASRKMSVEKQPSVTAKKKPSKRQIREISKEVIEELVETPAGEAEDQDLDMLPLDHSDRVVRYMEEEEMEEQE